MKTTRRTFLLTAAAATTLPRKLFAQDPTSLIAHTDRTRILSAAARYLPLPIQTITAFPTPRSPGGPHDFFSQADYFWPNPANPNGPYINRDGQSNPANFNDHRRAMLRLSIEMPALTAAWLLLTRTRTTEALACARKAAGHLRAWFIDPATRMTPNLEFAQGVHGVSTGRSYGIIDTLHLVEVARAASLLAPTQLTPPEQQALRTWFADYLQWLKTSDKGIKERDALNNHAVCWALQAAEFAHLIDDPQTRAEIRIQYKTKLLPNQLALNGSFPQELARTKPYSYSIFNFDVLATLCQSLLTTNPAEDLYRFTLADGRSICRAAAFLAPYLSDKSKWPYAHDIEHFDALPVRSPGLLFCGVHCAQPDYLTLWKRLNPDPTDPEIIRNYPIRQPLLWFA